MPQYTDPTTGRKVQLPYGPGQGFAPTGQGQGSSLFPTNSGLRMPGGQQTMGAAGTRQFPVNLNLPAGTQTTAPQSPTDRSSSLQNVAGQYRNINIPGQGVTQALGALPGTVTGQTFQGQQFIDQPEYVLPQLPGGGVGAPTSTVTGDPLGPPPNATWNPEGRWDTPAVTPPADPTDPTGPTDPTDPTDPNADRPRYGPGSDNPFTPPSPQLSGITDLADMLQTQQAGLPERRQPMWDMLSQRLQALSQPVTGEGREADAIRLANQRAAEKQRSALAAQMTQAGLATSGAMSGGQAGIDQWQGEANARAIAGLMQGERARRGQELQNLLGLAIQSGDVEAARNLEAQLQVQQMQLGQQRAYDDLGFRYAALGPSLQLQAEQQGQNWLLGLLNQMRA